jgi:uncharacterized repeat protein (TIGR01451 family)
MAHTKATTRLGVALVAAFVVGGLLVGLPLARAGHGIHDLSLTKTVPSGPTSGTVTYEVKIVNGPTEINNVRIEDFLPAGSSFQSSTADASHTDWECVAKSNGKQLNCTRSAGLAEKMDPGETITLTITLTNVPVGGVNIACSRYAEDAHEATPGNNCASVPPAGGGTDDVTVSKSPVSNTVSPGSDVTYQITVTGTGSPGTVTMNDAVPTNTTFQSVSVLTTGWSCPTQPLVGSGGNVQCTGTQLPAQINLVVKVDAGVPAGTQLANTATVGATKNSDTTNDTAASAPVTVGTPPAGGGPVGGGPTTTVAPRVAGVQVTRLGGADRIDTANIVSQDSFPNGDAGAVVLARSDLFPDALTGTPLAVAQRAPLLLTGRAALDPRTAAELQRVLPTGRTVFLLGGTAALSQGVANAVAALGYQVVRHGGVDRFATAVVISEALGNRPRFFVTSGFDFPDALAAGAAAANHNASILLTAGESRHPTTDAYLGRNPGRPIWAIGGPALRSYPGAAQVGGIDRYGTAALVASTFFAAPTTVGMATGESFPDSLTGGAHIGAKNGPMLLVRPAAPLPGQIEQYLADNKATLSTAFVYGGTAAVGNDVVAAVQAATTTTP